MKLLLLPVLSWTMAISQTFAQKQLPASIQSYAVNWSYAVKDMLSASGYEVPGEKSNVDLVQHIDNRSEELQLDSIISYFGYGINLNDSTPLLRNVFTYPEPTVQVVVEYFYDQDHWTALRRTTLRTDDLGRMEETIAESYDSESGVYMPESFIRLYPRDNSLELVDSFFIYEWSATDKNWDRQLAVWNQHDELNQLTESKSAIEIFEVPYLFLDRYRYDDSGKLMVIHQFFLDGGVEISAGKKEYLYKGHLLFNETTYVDNGSEGFLAQSKIEYAYNNFNIVEFAKSYNYDLDKQDWILLRVDAYGYDEELRVNLKEVTASVGEGIWDRRQTRINFVTDEYVASEEDYVYDTNLETWLLESKKYFFYDQLSAVEPDVPEANDDFFMYPNPSTGIVQIKLAGDVTFYVYSLSGQLVQKYQMTGGEKKLNLSHLPAGLYQVMAKSGEELFYGKIIMQ